MLPLPSSHFREMSGGEINVDPVHDEFFKSQDLTDALVREAIQNSLRLLALWHKYSALHAVGGVSRTRARFEITLCTKIGAGTRPFRVHKSLIIPSTSWLATVARNRRDWSTSRT
jgi:hypothetical protein